MSLSEISLAWLIPAALVLGGALLAVALAGPGRSRKRAQALMPKWPGDWPAYGELLNQKAPMGPPAESVGAWLAELPGTIYWGLMRLTWLKEGGYIAVRSSRQMIGSGGIRLGRLLPRHAFERRYPLEVWIPKSQISRHYGIAGPTGAGKTTTVGMAVPFYGALAGQSVFLNDVKAVEFFPWFCDHFRRNGAQAIYFGPWTPHLSLAAEPIHSATREEIDIIVNAVISSSMGTSKGDQGANKFFDSAGKQTLTGLVVGLKYLPRRYCNLPTLFKIVAAGQRPVTEMLVWIEKHYLTIEETEAAARRLVVAADGELDAEWVDEAGRRHARAADIEQALETIDRAGYETQVWVQEARAAAWTDTALATGRVSLDGPEWSARFRALRAIYADRRKTWEENVSALGTFSEQPEQTRGNIVQVIQNSLQYFKAPEMARAFSRPEFDIREIVRRPTFAVIGTLQAKKEVGARFVGNLYTTLALNLVYERGKVRGFDPNSAIDVLMLLEEMPQLGIVELPNILATIRYLRGAVTAIWQSDNQLKELWRDDYGTVLDNFVHQQVLYGSDGITAKRAADRSGKAVMLKKSRSMSKGGAGAAGTSHSTSESAERVDRLAESDIPNMVLNGKSLGEKGALSVGKSIHPFPMEQIPFWEDPVILHGLSCTEMNGRWKLPENHAPFPRLPLHRVEPAPPGSPEKWVVVRDEQGAPIPNAVATDRFRDTVDVLAPPAKPVYYELVDPEFKPEEIGITAVTAKTLQATLERSLGGGQQQDASAAAPAGAPLAATPATESVTVRPSWLPWIAALAASDRGLPTQPVMPYVQWAEQRYGWHEAADSLASARETDVGCRPRLLSGQAHAGDVDLDWYLVAGLPHVLDYPSWLFMWAANARVSPIQHPTQIRKILTNVVNVSDTLFGGVPPREPFWSRYLATDATCPSVLRDQTSQYLEVVRDRLASVNEPAEVPLVWAELRAGLADLVPMDLAPDSPQEIAERLLLAELVLDDAAIARATQIDLGRFVSPSCYEDAAFTKAFTESRYIMDARLLLDDEMQKLPQLRAALARSPRRQQALARLSAAVAAHGLETAIADDLGVPTAAATGAAA